jgi:flagellar biosynthesis protein FlhG
MSEIWTLASGKGGNGKSIIASLLSINLASSHKKVLLVDADYTGPNIHNLFKLKKLPGKNLSSFFHDKIQIEDIIYTTDFPYLHIIVGNQSIVRSDRIYYQQKLKFLRNITKISENYDYLILDLGAGASMDTVDTFLIADKKILVTTPEVTSIENLYFFIKKFIFRKLKIILTNTGHKEILKKFWNQSILKSPVQINKFFHFLSSYSEEISGLISKEISNLNLHLILNMVKTQNEAELGMSIRSIIQKHYTLKTVYCGYIEFLDQIRHFINNQANFANITRTTLGIELNKIVTNVTSNQNIKFYNSN